MSLSFTRIEEHTTFIRVQHVNALQIAAENHDAVMTRRSPQSGLPRVPTVMASPPTITLGAQSTSNLSGGFVSRLADILHWPDVRNSGSGGTGYLNPGQNGRKKFRDRVQTDVIAHNPDMVIIAGGINDQSYATASAVGTEAAILFDTIRTGLPNAKLVVVGPWWKDGSPPSDMLALRDAIQIAASTRAHLFIDSIAEGWITGTGRVGATMGDGNADIYTSSDSTHPTSAGRMYRAYRLAGALVTAFPS